ncbi:MAG: ATP-binding cassette domain-containing protein, partial [bacterium]
SAVAGASGIAGGVGGIGGIASSGGLVGYNSGLISSLSYANGNASATGGNSGVGGNGGNGGSSGAGVVGVVGVGAGAGGAGGNAFAGGIVGYSYNLGEIINVKNTSADTGSGKGGNSNGTRISIYRYCGCNIITGINATKVDPQLRKAQSSAFVAMYYAHETMRNAQIMHALGMSRNLEDLWIDMQKKMMAEQGKASDVGGSVMSASKFVSMTQSSLLLGIGAMLTLYGLMPGSGAMMIVASIIGGKALAPIAQLLGSWRMVTEAKLAFERLENLMVTIPATEKSMPLPRPQGNLTVENLIISAPGHPVPIIRGINFSVPAGKVLVVIGASGSGKSTLTRALMGVWPSSGGRVRLDGVDVYQWNKDELGEHIGYLPQEVDLFDGTVAENIARFGEVNMDQIEDICKLIGIHDLIMKLPNGYHSNIGDDGVTLSGGQRQRVGLARALYGYPQFIVMDEPNSNLDDVGEAALITAIEYMKSRGATQVIVTHRPAMIQKADILMVMVAGQIRMFGPANDVLAAINKANAEAAAQAAPVTPALAS